MVFKNRYLINYSFIIQSTSVLTTHSTLRTVRINHMNLKGKLVEKFEVVDCTVDCTVQSTTSNILTALTMQKSRMKSYRIHQ